MLPVVAWFKIHETGNLKLLYRETNLILFKIKIPFGVFRLDKVWEQIINEFIKVIGHSKEHIQYLDLLKTTGIQSCEVVINPTPYNKAMMNLNKAKLEEIEKKKANESKKIEYQKLIDQISTAKGYPMWKVSVVEFYAALNNLNSGR
jgi:hypothetical protein